VSEIDAHLSLLAGEDQQRRDDDLRKAARFIAVRFEDDRALRLEMLQAIGAAPYPLAAGRDRVNRGRRRKVQQ